MYTEHDLVKIGKRENNKLRPYLVINRLQGKHIPVKPSEAFNMFTKLADILRDCYRDEKLLLVGFAETATAIGACIAARLDSLYIQTTREIIGDEEYLFFSEAHSHATEQKLVRADIEAAMEKVDRIIFIEDEITTGNTLMNIIRLIDQSYKHKVKFAAASILNGMDSEAEHIYSEYGVSLHYLVKTNHEKYSLEAEKTEADGIYIRADRSEPVPPFKYLTCGSYQDARRLVRGGAYEDACGLLWKQIAGQIEFGKFNKIAVLGTEEFMFPALFAGQELERQGKEVFIHATTRSPIEVSRRDGYPLRRRYELVSAYDDERRIFIYDLDKYDAVLIITDAKKEKGAGINSLIHALWHAGSQEIYYIRWC